MKNNSKNLEKLFETAIKQAINKIGYSNFKKTSFFGSTHK